MTDRVNEAGVALVLVLMSIVLLSTIGAALVLVTSTESAIAGNLASASEAFYAADAMLSRAIRELRALPDWTPALSGTVASSFLDGSTHGTRTLAGGFVIDLDQVASQASCHKNACSTADFDSVSAERPWGLNNPRWRVFASGPLSSLVGGSGPDSGLHVIALIADDGTENDADPAQDGASIGGVANPGFGVIEVRAEAFGTGGVHRAVQATVSRFQTVEVGVGPITEVRILAWREVP